MRQVQSTAQQDTVLSSLMRAGNFSELLTLQPSISIHNPTKPGNPIYAGNLIPPADLSQQALQLLQFMPPPNLPGIKNNYLATVPTNDSWNQTVWRIDENPGKNSRIFFRYAWEKDTPLNGSTNPTGGQKSPNDDHNFVAAYTQTIGPTMVNDFRLGRQSLTTDSVNFFFDDPSLQARTEQLGIPGFTPPADNPGVPDVSITGFMGIGNGATNWFQTDQTWQCNDVFSTMHGAHNIAAGADLSRMETGRSAVNQPRGQFVFGGTISGFAAADLMLGLPLRVTTPAPEIPGVVAQWRDGFFILDKWQSTRKLTLTFGLRYELATVPYTVNGNGTNLNPGQTALIPANPPVPGFKLINPNHRDFAPRLGFAYRATDKWVVRGGFGIYFNPNQMNSFTFLNTNPPFSPVFTFDSSPSNPTVSLSNPTPSSAQRASGPPNVIGVGPDLPTARMNQWSLDVERTLWHNTGLDVQYLGSHSYHLDRSFFNNTPSPGTGPISARRPNQLWGVIRTISNDEIANYEGLNVVLRQRTNHGLTMLLSYTWSHTLDVSTDSNGGGAPMNPYNWRADYGNANWDIPNRLVASYVYDLPFFKAASERLVRWVFANWQVNGVTTIQGGLPFNVTVPGDPANTGVGNQRPNLVGPASVDCGQQNLTNCISAAPFRAPDKFTYGNAGRNILRGPHLITTDFSFFKNIPLGEKAKFQFRAEFFNLFNTPAFSNPSAVVGTETFGSITSTVNNNRQIQFAGKIIF